MVRTVVNRRRVMVGLAVFAVLVLVAWIGVADRVSAATSQFEDVPDSNVFGADINWLADAGVTRGCNPPANTRFCPGSNVTREQMAAFMHRLSGGDSRTLDGRLDALEAGGGVPSGDLAALEAAVAALTTRLGTVESDVETLEAKNAALEAENVELQALLAGVSRDGDTLLFTGMNLQVVNGQGSTATRNSLGNVIIGYNKDIDDVRTGSHYLVIGDHHTYTGYSGIVAGADNTVTGNWSSVTGGGGNTAGGSYSSVTGGSGNEVSGFLSSVTGGSTNVVSGDYSSVTGGSGNEVVGDYDTVVGGDDKTNISWDGAIAIGEGFWDAPDS